VSEEALTTVEGAADETPDAEPAEPAAPAAAEPQAAPDCRLAFAGVELVLPDTNPVLLLQEMENPYRELRVPIGMPEGVAIAYAWRGIATPRPLTHELLAAVMRAFGITLEVVRITEVRGSSYSAEISLNGRPGPRTVGCRLSDAVALALRQPLPVPIMTTEAVMEASTTPG
jgi:bifunctional DNase/RNase